MRIPRHLSSPPCRGQQLANSRARAGADAALGTVVAVADWHARYASSAPTRSPVADRQIVYRRAHNDRYADVGHTPVVADALFLEKTHDPGGCAKRHRSATSEKNRVNAIERARRLERHAERFGRADPLVTPARAG